MKRHSVDFQRCTLTVLILSCIFGNLFPFLNIDLGFVILTPIRSVLILASIYCMILWKERIKRKGVLANLKKDWLAWCTFCFLAVWFILGSAWIIFGNTGSGAVTEVIGILTVCMLAFCCFTLVRSEMDVRYLLRLLVLCGAILALLACIEVVIGSFTPGTRYYFTLAQKISRKQTLYSPTTVFYNPNDFAAFMLLCMSIVCYWIVRADTRRDFLCCLAILLLMVIPTVLTNSTIFFIFSVILIGITVLALLFNRSKSQKSRLGRISVIVVGSVLFALFGMTGVRSAAVSLNRSYFTAQIQQFYAQNQVPVPSAPGQDQPGLEDIPVLPEIDFSDIEDPDTLGDQLDSYQKNFGTIHIRKWLIIAGLDYFTDSPLIGNGPDSFHERISQDMDYLQQTRRITNTHCFYIELLSQYGLLLFTIYMGIVLYLVIRAGIQSFRELRHSRPDWGVLCLFLICVFSVVILMPSSIIRFSSLWIFLILAICVFCKGKHTEAEAAEQ